MPRTAGLISISHRDGSAREPARCAVGGFAAVGRILFLRACKSAHVQMCGWPAEYIV
jgi:hypothetical protein